MWIKTLLGILQRSTEICLLRLSDIVDNLVVVPFFCFVFFYNNCISYEWICILGDTIHNTIFVFSHFEKESFGNVCSLLVKEMWYLHICITAAFLFDTKIVEWLHCLECGPLQLLEHFTQQQQLSSRRRHMMQSTWTVKPFEVHSHIHIDHNFGHFSSKKANFQQWCSLCWEKKKLGLELLFLMVQSLLLNWNEKDMAKYFFRLHGFFFLVRYTQKENPSNEWHDKKACMITSNIAQ